MTDEVRKDGNYQEPADSTGRMADFVSCFRETKHYLLNSVAIWTAQAQLARRHPEYYEKLAESIVERSERLVEMTREAEEKLRAFAPYPPIPTIRQSSGLRN
ncbi:MAG: hypothetical protein WB586_03075 [Chthoniobacterales bacterium]